jgi:glycosyltransferase involved in cell wall biosynthesis
MRPVVMTYGPLVGHAGLETVLDAAIVLQQEAPGLNLAIVGAGPLERDLRIEVAALGLSANVIVVVPTLPLAEVIAVADLLVIPSPLPADEGMVIDAMALGRPVMAAKGALPDALLTHGETGYLVTPGHGQALASAIADLFARPAVMAELAENARRQVAKMNDAQVLVDAVAAVYRRVGS